MRVVQITDNEIVTIHALSDFVRAQAFCYSCDNRAVVAADYSNPNTEPFRRYFCQDCLDRAELEEVELCLSKT